LAYAYIGTSGWNYRNWRDGFYGDTPQKRWLNFCSRHFTGIEVNGTFYRLQSPETFRRWRDETGQDFRFAIKANRYLTHNKKLIAPSHSLQLEKERADALGNRLAAVLWQLPNGFKKNFVRLAEFAHALEAWPSVRHAVEFRHASWFDDEVADCLSAHGIAVCQSDAADWPLWNAVTTNMVYVRLHGHTRTYASAYSDKQLDEWAGKANRWLAEGRDVHVYFDNDSEGAAPIDAMRLIQRVRLP
jgi:uncharacterized protein YecE (DUF72 family)